MIKQSNHSPRCFLPLAALLVLLPALCAAQPPVRTVRGWATRRAFVDFSKQGPARGGAGTTARPPIVIPRHLLPPHNLPVPDSAKPDRQLAPQSVGGSGTPPPGPGPTPGPLPPTASVSFQGLQDDGTRIPPDTNGAVGPRHVMTMVNSQVNIQTRTGGAVAGWPKSLQTFWAAVGPFSTSVGAFDPRTTYDPYNDRWIVTGGADAFAATSSVLIGVSQTNDPTGAWNLYRFDADPTDTVWADHPAIGFNKNWIVVTVNMFTMGGGFSRADIYVFNKANLYAGGTGLFTRFQVSGQGGDFIPAVTFDNALATEYMVQIASGNSNGSSFLRTSNITGSVGAEVLNATAPTFVSSALTFAYSGPNAPQLGDPRLIASGDTRPINCVYRNGSLWSVHTAFLPANAPTRASVQWWQFTPAGGNAQQAGRVDDPTSATFYCFPSIAVNANNDVLIGYSRFSASQYASGDYSFRFGTDPANTLQADTVLKAGENSYFKDFGQGVNRWGDYSHTVVDPVDDINMWTIQEYASTPTNNWGVWWGKISLRTGTFTGTVLDRNRQPLANAEVHLFNLDTGQFAFHTVNTNVSGAYSLNLEEVPPGRYHIGAYKSGVNMWIFSPNFQGFTVPTTSANLGPTEIVLDVVSATKGAVQGFVRYDDVTGAHPIGLGVHIDVYDGGHLVASTDTDANGHYQINGLDCINIDGAHPWWGWHTYIATWTDANKVVRKAIGVNFGTWAGVPIRMDIPFKIP